MPGRNAFWILAAIVAVVLAVTSGVARVIAHPSPPASSAKPAQHAKKPLELWSAQEQKLVELEPVEKSDEQWKSELAPLAYSVLRRSDTERAGTSPLNDEHRAGVFHCAGCGTDLFSSRAKFESGTGWPSFYQPIHPNNVAESKHGSRLFGIEVHCPRCQGHLGHVFTDGPKPTGLRYCINGAALRFEPER